MKSKSFRLPYQFNYLTYQRLAMKPSNPSNPQPTVDLLRFRARSTQMSKCAHIPFSLSISPSLSLRPEHKSCCLSVPCWSTPYVTAVTPSNPVSPLPSNLTDWREPESVQDVNRRSCFSTTESRIRLWHHSRTRIRVRK